MRVSCIIAYWQGAAATALRVVPETEAQISSDGESQRQRYEMDAANVWNTCIPTTGFPFPYIVITSMLLARYIQCLA